MYQKIFETGIQVVKKIQSTQQTAIEQSAQWIAEAFLNGHTFFVSGSGHSHTVCEEFYGRAGGLAFTVPILTNELTMTEHPTKSSYIEKLSGYAAILCELYHIQKMMFLSLLQIRGVMHIRLNWHNVQKKKVLVSLRLLALSILRQRHHEQKAVRS